MCNFSSVRLPINFSFTTTVLLVASVLYGGSCKSNGTTAQEIVPEDPAVELVVPKVYKGEGLFNRVELFRYEKSRMKRKSLMLQVRDRTAYQK